MPKGAEQLLQRAWQGHGPLAIALLPAAALLGAIAAVRRFAYRAGWLRSERLPVPVVVVGNLVVGGAGKTPAVIALAALLRHHGHRPGIVSRGFGRATDALVDVQPDTPVRQCGDEPLLLRMRTGAPVCVGRDRASAARLLLRNHPNVNVILSDDGLQHLRLQRDAQVLVFDERGAGNGWLLPAGPLREPMPTALPPRSVVLYNASRPTTMLPGHTVRRGLAGAVPLDGWWRGEPPTAQALDALRGRPLLAAAGMARPQRFFDALRQRGLSIEPLPLPDHHDYATLPWPPGTADVIVTEKDAVKLAPQANATARVWVATLDYAPDPAFDAALLALLPPAPLAP